MSHNSRLWGGQWVHPGTSAVVECQSKPRCCDCCNMAALDAGERSACAGASVADGRPRLVMQQCTVVTLTIHFTLQAASAGQTKGMGAIPHKSGGTHPPQAAVSLPLVYSQCQRMRVSHSIRVYACVCPCPRARTPLKRQLVVIKCNDMYISTVSVCGGFDLCSNARELSCMCLNHKICFIRFQAITLSSLKHSQEPLALTSLPNEAVIEPPGSRLHISGTLLMKLAAGSTENHYISASLHFVASVCLNALKKQFTGNYSRTLC